MKKRHVLLAAILVAVFVMMTAGDTFARGRGERGRRAGIEQGAAICQYCEGEARGRRGWSMRGMGPIDGVEIPQEIQDKWAEARRLGSEMRAEMGNDPINRDRVLELRQEHRAIIQQISDWRFEQRLDALMAR